MIPPRIPDEDARRELIRHLRPHLWALFIQGVIFLIFGILAIALPQIGTLAVTILIGWLFVFGGVMRLFVVGRMRHMPGRGWAMAAAALAVALGLVIVAAPLRGILTLTLVLIALFIIEGAAAIAGAISLRRYIESWPWLVFGGIVDLLLAAMIWAGWPDTASWAIGILAGVNLVFLGLSFIMIGLAIRRHSRHL